MDKDAPWSCTGRMDMDIGSDMDRDCYWTGALGRNYAKAHYYMYIDIVVTRNYELSCNYKT
jgi:hypothetical protein